MKVKQRVIFLCTGNSARSQMAEAFLRKYGGSSFQVHSAGLDPKGIHPLTERVMEEIGFSLSGHTSKSVDQYLSEEPFAYLFTVCSNAEQNCPRSLLKTAIHTHWDLEDPAVFEGTCQEMLEKFREVRDQIDCHVQQWLTEQ